METKELEELLRRQADPNLEKEERRELAEQIRKRFEIIRWDGHGD